MIFSFKLLFYSFQYLPISVSIVLLLISLCTALLYFCYSLILWLNYIHVKIHILKILKQHTSIHETKDKHIKSDSKNSKKKKKSSSNIILITQMWKCESVHTRI